MDWDEDGQAKDMGMDGMDRTGTGMDRRKGRDRRMDGTATGHRWRDGEKPADR